MGEVVVRAATPADAPVIGLLGTQVFLHNYARQGLDASFVREVKAHFDPGVVAREIAHPGTRFLLAERAGLVLGFAKWTAGTRHALLTTDEPAAELDRLYVQESSTGTGVGKVLLRATETAAQRSGAAQLWLTAWVGNPRALRFYASHGYVDAGGTEYRFDGASVENRFFVKPLVRTDA